MGEVFDWIERTYAISHRGTWFTYEYESGYFYLCSEGEEFGEVLEGDALPVRDAEKHPPMF